MKIKLNQGLSENEVETALKIAGAYEATNTTNINNSTRETENNTALVVKKNENLKVAPNTSIWARIFRWIKTLILAGCLTYTAYKLFIKVCDAQVVDLFASFLIFF